MYVNSTIRMTQDGDWLTPKLMGRMFLFKAPLLQWLSAISIKLFGLGLITVRLPSLLFGAAAVSLVFAWTALARNVSSGLVAAGLLAANSVWMTFARLCFTDVLASTLALCAVFVFAQDPALAKPKSAVWCGVLAGASMLAKSIVGLLPFVSSGAFFLLTPRDRRPSVSRMVQCVAAAFLVTAPWHVYQLLAHREWFWNEFVRYQLLAVGVTQATGVTDYPFFYLRRLSAMDPALSILSAISLVSVAVRFRKSRRHATPALCYLATVAAALALFRGRSVSYLTILIPVLCLITGLYLPDKLKHQWPVLLAIVGTAFGVKAAIAGQPWSLPYSAEVLASASSIHDYYLLNRDTELIIASADDAFYAITLPLPRVRYCYVDTGNTVAGFAPHYLSSGVAVTPGQLKKVGSSPEPTASAILLRSPSDIVDVLGSRPIADFDVPENWESMLTSIAKDTHTIHRAGARIFLLNRAAKTRQQPSPALPPGW